MKSIVSESLSEYKFNIALLESQNDSDSMPKRVYRFIKTLPARKLRKLRALQLMNSYEKKIKYKIDKILPKYKPNLIHLIKTTQQNIKKIDSTFSNEKIKRIKKDIVYDLNKNLQNLLNSIKTSMQDQVKLYSSNIQDRINKEGTITGVNFYPEEKLELLSKWQEIEDNINKYIQDILINLLNSPELAQYQEIKLELEDYVSNTHRYNMRFDDDYDDEDEDEDEYNEDIDDIFISDTNQELNNKNAIDLLKQLDIKLNTPYFIVDKIFFEDPKPPKGSYIKFKIDPNSKRLYYIFGMINPRTDEFTPLRGAQKIYIIKKDNIEDEWKEVIENIQMGIVKRF